MAFPTSFKSPAGKPMEVQMSPAGPVPVPYPNVAQNAGGTAKPVLLQAAEVQKKQIAYNPKLDPKYNAHAGIQSASTSSSAGGVDPRSCAGQSLVGKDLSAAVGAGGASAGSASAKSAGK